MKKIKIIFFVVLIVCVLSEASPNKQALQSGGYITTGSRTSSVKESCAGLSRQSLSRSEGRTISGIEDFLRGYFSLDGSKIMRSAIIGDDEGVSSQLNSNLAPIVMLVLPFAIGAAILVLLSPVFLICCCFRPWCCRSLRFWQKDESEWTWRETKLPAILGSILLLGCLAASFAGFAFMSELKAAYEDTLCARAIVFDDLINGNVSSTSGSYFVGLQTFQNQIPSFLENFGSLNQSFADVTSTSGTIKIAKQQLGETVTQLTNIPSGTGKPLNLVYPSPLNDKNATKTIRSQFTTILGSIDEPSSMIGKTYKKIVDSKNAIDKVSEISDYYMEIAGPSTNEIGIIQDEIEASIVSLYEVDNSMQTKIKNVQDGPYWLTIGAYITFAFVTLFAIGALVSNCCLAFKNRIGCRYLTYVSLGGLFILGLMGFALTITSAIGVPATLFFCDYADSSYSNAENLKENLAGVIDNPKLLEGVSECAPSARGTMLNVLTNDDLIRSIEALPQVIEAMQSVDTKTQSAEIIKDFASLEGEIKGVLEGKKLDITDQASITILDKLSKSYQYKCVANGFHEDSWIPSLQQNPEKIPCKFGLGAIADHTTCAMGEDFETRAPGCVGCMDTYGLFKFTDTKAAVENALTLRYKGDGCGPFIADLSNVWNNFYKVKKTKIGPVLQRYQQAKSTIELGVDTLNRNIQPLFASVKESLDNTAGGFIDPKFGIGAGLNCKLIGQDMEILANNACGRMLPNIYIMLIIFGVISFAILVGLCFLTCSVARNTDKWVQDSQKNGVKSESDEAAAPKSPRSRTARSRANTGSSREILADAEKQDKMTVKVPNATGPTGEKLELKQQMRPAHGRARYHARNMH